VANGDLGVVVDTDAGRRVAFPAAGHTVRLVPPARLEAVDTVHAMTIHKSQGSEFDEVVVVLPPEGSPLLLRELLYTAITRARSRVTVVATEGAVRAAVGRAVTRGSGLAERLVGAPSA
jgi:exodeoxyribonuclease V alpha subunit